MKIILHLTLLILVEFSVFSQVKDIDGNEYITVKIGKQEWMSENLRVSHFRNGDEISQARNAKEWEKALVEQKPVWMYLNFSEENKTFPKLYNWYALHDTRGIAPKGWKICSKEDVSSLITEIGTTETAGKKLKSSTGWERNGEKKGTNDFGFNGSQTGSYNPYGYSDNNAQNASWWTSTIKPENHKSGEPDLGVGFYLSYFLDTIGWENPDQTEGRAIRCLKSN